MTQIINDATSATLAAARTNLGRIVASGAQNTSAIVERILGEIPTDRLASARGIQFEINEDGPHLATGTTETDGVPSSPWERMHPHAFGQLTQRAGVPLSYAKMLLAGEDGHWQDELLQHIVRTHLAHDESQYLLRSVNGEVRGFLSDRYRRLDSRPLFEAFVGACRGHGAVPYEGVANSVRVSVRAILPRIVEPVPGEAMVFGLNWHNSDFGAGAYSVTAFALRLVCLNGMIGENQLKQIHLGRRLDESHFNFSARTYQLDTETMTSATTDIVEQALSLQAIEQRCDVVRRAHEQEMDWRSAWGRVNKLLTKTEGEAAKTAFESQDVVMLPPGKTAWRFSNALSWVANQAEDPERKMELQQLAGGVIAA